MTAMIVMAIVVVFAIATLAKTKSIRHGKYQLSDGDIRRKKLLTSNESEFLTRLELATPEFRFHAQVCMGALLEPAIPKSENSKFMSIRGRFSQKIVDFVAQRKIDGEVIAIIELDDKTHDQANDIKRDRMLEMAGYRVIRWQSKAKPTPVMIRAALLELADFGNSKKV